MSQTYSPKLIQKCQQVFKKKAGRKISKEEAEIILERLARVGMLAEKIIRNKQEYEKNHPP